MEHGARSAEVFDERLRFFEMLRKPPALRQAQDGPFEGLRAGIAGGCRVNGRFDVLCIGNVGCAVLW